MKNPILLIVTLLTVSVNINAQDRDSKTTTAKSNNPSIQASPLYILSADNKTLQIQGVNKTDSLTTKNLLSSLDPQLIVSMNVMKGKGATDKYGALGQNGVVLIYLKRGALKKLPVELSRRFKDN